MTIEMVLSGGLLWHVEHGDSLVVLKSMPDACVDAIVTDPPAGTAFMGKGWDEFGRVNDRAIDPTKNNKGLLPSYGRGGTPEDRRKANRRARDAFIPWLTEVLEECYRVTKPGGRMLCWSIPRTMHWTGCAIEDAGWSIENTIAHLFGSGFPKAKTQLKPAREDWWLARKPAQNVLPLNIDECRVATSDNLNGGAYAAHGGRDILPGDKRKGALFGMLAPGQTTGREFVQPSGRWPANLVLSHAAGCVCVGTRRVATGTATAKSPGTGYIYGHREGGSFPGGYADEDGNEGVPDWRCVEGCPVAELDRHSGGASRFFNTFGVDRDDIDTAMFVYQAKASRADREAGCDGLPERLSEGTMDGGVITSEGRNAPKTGRVLVRNGHPTVKSTPLMRHLVKLIAKPGDVVLDAFCGSGSTGCGAVLEGCRFIGIEREDTEADPYVTIARRRIAAKTPLQRTLF